MKYEKDLVSVVIPTYKRSDMLCRAIESILNQTYKHIECIVVNDNNPGDDYSQILYKKLDVYKSDKRFKFIEQKTHRNGAVARNVGIYASKGEYIAFLDDDDYWESNKAEAQIAILEKLPDEWGAVSCLMKLYRDGKVFSAPCPYKDGMIHFEVLSRLISMGTGSLIIRRQALDDTGYFDENLLRYQDPQLFSYLAEKYKIKLLKRYLHNRDIDDSQNRPSIQKISVLHEAFFESVAPQFARMSKRKVEQVKAIYELDKFSVYWHCGERIKALRFLAGAFKYPKVALLSTERIVNRFRSRYFIESRMEKYK